MTNRRWLAVGCLLWSLGPACAGNPMSPSDESGTMMFDGQTFQGTSDGSTAFSRARSGLDWIDVVISRCSDAPGIAITLKGVTTPPAPGVYAVNNSTDVVSANASISREMWGAGIFQRQQYCGAGFGPVVLPPCADSSPGSGSVTISSSSSERVMGSYRFVLMLPTTYSGPISLRPPPTTKVVEGSFNLRFDDRALC